jgi:flagellar motor switch protein FliM
MTSTPEHHLTNALTGQSLVGRTMEEHPAWPMISRLPVLLAVNIPVRGFKLRALLELRCGQTIESEWASNEDVPVNVGTMHVSWGEFEVVEQRVALRLTRLA